MIGRIVGRQEAMRVSRVAHGLVEIDHGIEMSARANPRVDGFAIALSQCVMVISGPDEWRKRPTINAQAMRMGAQHNLLVSGGHSRH